MDGGSVAIQAGPTRLDFKPHAEQWSTAELTIPARDLPTSNGAAAVEVRAESGELFLHLIEVRGADNPLPPRFPHAPLAYP